MSLKDWKKILITPATTIKQAMELMNDTGFRIVLVVDNKRKLLGSITDGDFRRAILKRQDILESVQCIMNTTPITALMNDSAKSISTLMKNKSLLAIPILNDEGEVVGLETVDSLNISIKKETDVVLMAGGFGKRLHPLTQNCPKPLLKIRNKPLLESIIENFIEQGFLNFYISVYYKSEAIQDYFQDGKKWGCKINYILEHEPLGTAGALSLLPGKTSNEFIVMNGDIITNVNYGHLCNFHKEHGGQATMCVREYVNTMPYGCLSDEPNIFSVKRI